MLYVVHALDNQDALQTRAKHYRDHRTHLDRAADEGIDILAAGTLVADDNETPIGSLFVVDAADQAQVEAFCDRDPYQTGGVWQRVQIHPYVNRRGWASRRSTGI